MSNKILCISFTDGTPPIVGNERCLNYMLSVKEITGYYGISIQAKDSDEEGILRGILVVHGINIETFYKGYFASILTLTPIEEEASHVRLPED